MSKPEVNQRSSGDQSCALPFIGMSYCNCGVRRRGQRVLLLLVLVLVEVVWGCGAGVESWGWGVG